MAEVQSEPTMEDILSSIKKIIAEDSGKGLSPARPRKFVPQTPVADAMPQEPEDVLELTEASVEDVAPVEEETTAAPEPFSLVSEAAEEQSRSALDALSALIVKPDVAGSDTLEGLVREMLRPVLKEWLDANLPRIVEAMVSREIARITGKTLV